MNKRGKTIMMLCLTVLLLGACSVKAAGNTGYSTTLELTGGESWKLISSCENTPHEFVTGAGFRDERTGFLSCRYTQDAGPVIYATQDGGSSWERLPVAEGYDGFSKTSGSPVMTAQSVWFPVVLRDEAGNETTVYYSSQDMETWSWG